MKKQRNYIAIETGNYGYVTIEVRELKDWIFQLSKDELVRLDFTDEEHRRVKSLFLRKQLRKTYSPLVYDFALSMLNEKVTEEMILYERHFF